MSTHSSGCCSMYHAEIEDKVYGILLFYYKGQQGEINGVHSTCTCWCRYVLPALTLGTHSSAAASTLLPTSSHTQPGTQPGMLQRRRGCAWPHSFPPLMGRMAANIVGSITPGALLGIVEESWEVPLSCLRQECIMPYHASLRFFQQEGGSEGCLIRVVRCCIEQLVILIFIIFCLVSWSIHNMFHILPWL